MQKVVQEITKPAGEDTGLHTENRGKQKRTRRKKTGSGTTSVTER